MERNDSPRDIVGPAVLISIGVVFLLQNFGILPHSIWKILWRFWPVLLVLSGLQLIIGRRRRGSVVVGVMTLIVFSGMVSYALFKSGKNPRLQLFGFLNKTQPVAKKEFRMPRLRYDLESIDSLNYSYDVGAVLLDLQDSQRQELLSIASTLPKSNDLEVEESLENGDLDVLVTVETTPFSFHGESRLMSEHNSYGIPTNFDVNVGAGKAILAFSETLIETIDLNVGAGSSVLDLSELATPSAEIKIDVGVGSVDVILPPSVAFSIDYNVGVGSIEVNGISVGSGFGNSGSYKEVEDESLAPDLVFDVNIGTGSVFITTRELE